MVENGNNESAQTIIELGTVNGIALYEAKEFTSAENTANLIQKNEKMMEQVGTHPSCFSTLRQRAVEYAEMVLPKNINWKNGFSAVLTGSMMASLIVQAACSPEPINVYTDPDTRATETLGAKSEESQKGSIGITGAEVLPSEDIYITTPEIEAAMSTGPEPKATAIEEENYYVDSSVTPEEWNKLFNGNDNFSVVLDVMEDNKEKDAQYQVWLENGQAFGMVGKSAYFSEIEGKSILYYLDPLNDELEFKEGDLELKVFDKVMESQLFVPREYLTEEIKDVRATVVHMELEGDKYVYDFLGEGGGVYVNEGEVEIIKSGELPDYLSEEVKEKFRDYKRVDVNNGVVEGSGLRKSE